MSEGAKQPQDGYISRLKEARKSPAVLKIRLANLRSRRPNCLVFAFEGDADKAVYFQWVRRVREELCYEPFPCDGKKQVFSVREMLRRDLTSLASRVYFFVDRDFDDMAGNEESADTFMTDQYSVENYLVTKEVFEELLKDEFHCHAEPQVREHLLAEFERRYSEFLQIIKEVNKRLYIARRLGIRLTKQLPDSINHLAVVALNSVTASTHQPDAIVAFSSAPCKQDEDRLADEFSQLDPPTRYRGKFNHLFLMKWLDLLCCERRDANSNMFPGLNKARVVNIQGITLGMLASKSSLPTGFRDFIQAVQ
ncbi:DUF4435 domain-containing protein [Bradyrhizobium sp. C-145]|uniref:DUF4435 domain-containing protein n=1 Tax=Bradyrhizobium sp. C-145 TaxID=574727 RepID=UPI00201B4B02|nr:DUF4435 domain-containing protein [Bradyrhizobium sp. C-145]UQR61818.1 DUF4435 domain-containing protein [Bradyrhizobium sp. C-145]